MLDLFRRVAPSELVAQRTVADLDAASDAFAAALLDRGFLYGDRLAIAVRDEASRATGLLGAWKAGGSVVLADPAVSTDELAGLLAESGATALLADGARPTTPTTPSWPRPERWCTSSSRPAGCTTCSSCMPARSRWRASPARTTQPCESGRTTRSPIATWPAPVGRS